MATRRNNRQVSSRALPKASAASKITRKVARNVPSQPPPETSESSNDDDSNDEQDDDNEDDEDENDEEDEEDEEEQDSDSSDDTPNNPAMSHLYPFEFDNDSLTGTDDEDMNIDSLPNNTAGKEFERSMEMADMHTTMGAQDTDRYDYAAMDDIDDEEDEDEDTQEEENEDNVLRAAEKDLIAEFEQTEHQQAGTGNVSFVSTPTESIDPLTALDVNLNDDPFQGARFMDDNWGTMWETAELGIWRRPDADGQIPDAARNPRSKRVRFKESTVVADQSSDSNSDSEEEEEEDQFPDIFMDSADPKIQQLLATETEADWHGFSTRGGSDVESVYDFEDDADRFAFEMDVDSESDGAEDSSSSETEDDGDDTEDETPEEQQAKMQKFRREMKTIFARNRATTPQPERPTTATSTNSSNSAKRRLITPRSAKGPVQGTFICDPTKATLTTDKATRKTILYPPVKPSPQQKEFWERAKTASQKGTHTPAGSIAVATRPRDVTPERPFTAKATLGSMFDGRIDLFDAAPPLPTPTANPYPPIAPSLLSSLSSAADEVSDMDAEYPTTFSTLLNMEHFEDDSSDTDMTTPAVIEKHQPAFLSQGVVGSFRLNQHRAKMESSLASNPAKRASTAEYNALQYGRRGAGNAPITPARKRRSNSDVDLFKTGSGVKKNTTPAYSSPIVARRRHSRGQSLSGRLDQTLTPEIWKKS